MSIKDEIIKLAEKMLTSPARMSAIPSDWSFPKAVPKYFRRNILRKITILDDKIKDWAVELRMIADAPLHLDGIKELIEYARKIIIIPRSELEALTKFNCDHVIFSGKDRMHCDVNTNDAKRGACCNSCYVRRWAKQKLKIKD